jgi:hypothetical protein
VYYWRSWPGGGIASREFDPVAPDVVSVLAWAADNANVDEILTVFVVVDAKGERGVVRLAGDDRSRRE